MDDFTQNLLERAKLRRQKLNTHLSQANTPLRAAKPLQENNFSHNVINGNEQPTSDVSITPSGKAKLRKLGQLYSENDDTVHSPIHRGEEKLLEEAPRTHGKSKCRLGRLNELASHINQWEDDLSRPDLRSRKEPTKTKYAAPSRNVNSRESSTISSSVVNTSISLTTIHKDSKDGKTSTATIVTGTSVPKVEESCEDRINRDEKASAVSCTSTFKVVSKSTKPISPASKKSLDKDEEKELAHKVPRLESEKKSEKQFAWDQAILHTLESQGFSKAQDEKLVYLFGETPQTKTMSPSKKSSQSPKSPRVSFTATGSPYSKSPVAAINSSLATIAEKKAATKILTSPMKTAKLPINRGYSSPSKSPKMGVSALDKDSSVLKRAAFFETNKGSPVKSKDPAELTLAERKALFEKNKGAALLPKVAFSTPLPAKLIHSSPVKSKKAAPIVAAAKAHSPAKPKSQIASIREKLEKDLVEATNVNMSKLEREKDLDILRNRWNKNKQLSGYAEETTGPPPPPPMPIQDPTPSKVSPMKAIPKTIVTSPVANVEQPKYVDSPEALRAVKDVKKIVMSPPKEGRLYPSLSDIEVTNAEEEESEGSSSPDSSFNNSKRSDMYLNLSFGEMLEVSKNNPITPPRRSNVSDVLNALDEALADVSSSDDGPTPPKHPRVSNSFVYSHGSCPMPEEKPDTPLLHTVSFYRKQQSTVSSAGNTPMKVIKRNEVPITEREVIDESLEVKKKIEELQLEVGKQQTVISQASNLLSVCLANIEFSGSEEQVEGERLLLLASHKRQACLNEIQRLKVEGTLRPIGPSCDELREQGDLLISGITIPLKRETLRAMSADESMHYFVCLVKCDERVVATPVVAASSHNLDGNVLRVTGEARLDKLHSDFKATVEVYNLVLSRELLPHHIKYHLPGKKDKKLLTPSKSKKTLSRMVMPSIQSPAGPNAVRTTNFQMCGYVVFSLRELRRTQWTMNKVPYISPVEGSITMKIDSDLQLDDEFRGFLSMFDDVSGLGAWHRRWCLLSAHTLSYWKYPDDENKKIPLGTIDLRSVITTNVGLVSRDVCARLHTFLLETTRPRTANDTESLILLLEGDVARVRHLLSADTKEERLEWCAKLNKALALLRAWSCQS